MATLNGSVENTMENIKAINIRKITIVISIKEDTGMTVLTPMIADPGEVERASVYLATDNDSQLSLSPPANM